MSSLAAAQADGYYHPPDYDPQRHGSRSKFQGSTGANQWEKYGIIRFEMPHKAWCLGCKRSIGQGTRYNAKKNHVGNYFSTRIYEFTMRCATCPQQFVIRTDPKNSEYEFVSGIKKFHSDFPQDTEQSLSFLDEESKQRIESDPLFRLEHEANDKHRAQQAAQELIGLQQRNEVWHNDSFATNRLLRRSNRSKRRVEKRLKEEGRNLGLGFSLIEEDEADKAMAKLVMHSRLKSSNQNEDAVSDRIIEVRRYKPQFNGSQQQTKAIKRRSKEIHMHVSASSTGIPKNDFDVSDTLNLPNKIKKRKRRRGNVSKSSAKETNSTKKCGKRKATALDLLAANYDSD